MFKYTNTPDAPAAIGPYSQAIMAGDTLYASGMLGIVPATGELPETFEAQAQQIMVNIKAVLDANGLTFENVVKTTCFLKDMGDFAVFNGIYEKHFVSKPARSCVAVAALPKGALVEVEILAVK